MDSKPTAEDVPRRQRKAGQMIYHGSDVGSYAKGQAVGLPGFLGPAVAALKEGRREYALCAAEGSAGPVGLATSKGKEGG